MRYFGLLLILCMTLLQTSCGIFKTELDKCRELREYQQARAGERAQVPDDLEALPDDAWLPIPEGPTNTTATPAESPCLIEPPEYRPN
ncbi:MAG: hypothetical protein HKN56_01145 [Gammaproteobacteria bacterium]|nr:hypothetical protein [Gammaproteobacteria bacterium]NND53560.1 hypothetical protein [Gammaproteobacteria bacterium]